MAVSVNVAATAIQSGIGVCQTSVHELQSAAQALESGYASAGSGWHDDKYAQLGRCYTFPPEMTDRKDLEPFAALGRDAGLTVRIGG